LHYCNIYHPHAVTEHCCCLWGDWKARPAKSRT